MAPLVCQQRVGGYKLDRTPFHRRLYANGAVTFEEMLDGQGKSGKSFVGRIQRYLDINQEGYVNSRNPKYIGG